MIVRDIMSTSLITTGPATSFRDLWKLIFKNNVNAVLVVDKQKKLQGIIAREDLLSRLYPDYADLFASEIGIPDFEEMEDKIRELSGLTAADVMCRRVLYTREDTQVMRALSRMIIRRVNQLPVLSEDDAVVGLVTKGDIFSSVIKKELRRGSRAKQPLSRKKSSK